MKVKLLRGIVACSMAAIVSQTAWGAEGEYLWYAPAPLSGASKPQGEGVLVKRITIRKGDTLWKISRRNTGKASYFPQILLFNKIKNPDLIYAGAKLRVPVKSVAAHRREKVTLLEKPELKPAPAYEVSPEAKPELKPAPESQVSPEAKPELKPAPESQVAPGSKPEVEARPEEVPPEAAKPEPVPPQSVAPPAAAEPLKDEQAAYQKAKKAYSNGDYQAAAEAFDDFLRRFPDSPLAPDAALYKGDAYMRMSEKGN